jgi:hypothetical protein
MKHHQQPSELTLVDFQVIGAVLGEAFPAMTGLWHEEARMIRLQFDSPTLEELSFSIVISKHNEQLHATLFAGGMSADIRPQPNAEALVEELRLGTRFSLAMGMTILSVLCGKQALLEILEPSCELARATMMTGKGGEA